MSDHFIKKRDQGVTEGSMFDVAFRSNRSVESVIADAKVVVMIDRSSSMLDRDVPPDPDDPYGYNARHDTSKPTREERAHKALAEVQQKYQGKVLLISFADIAQYELSGIPEGAAGGTNMEAALEKAIAFDGTDMEFILISDGEPNWPDQTRTAARRFKNPIHTIYIGPDGGAGLQFLKSITTGIAAGKVDPKMIGKTIAGLLEGK